MNSKVNSRCETACCASIRSSQAGFSLIELMVASTIGLLIMAAVLTLFLNVSRTNDEMAKTNVLIENGRFAIQLLQSDIAHAGFWDSYIPDFDDLTLATAPAEIPTGVPWPCLAFSSWTAAIRTNRLGIPIQVHNTQPSGCDTVITNRKSGTDILVVRHVDTCVAGASGCEAEVGGKLYFQASRCESDANSYVLGTSGHTLRERNCTDIAPKRRFISHVYYIRDYAVTTGDGIPTLVRSELDLESGAVKAKAAVALIEGIEGFRVELGVDRISDAGIDIIDEDSDNDLYREAVDWANTDNLTSPRNRGDGVPDEFVHCSGVCSVDRLVNVVAVKLHLLVRSLTSTAGYVDGKTYKLGEQAIAAANDGFKRHVFSTVVRLNNVSGRRETP
ncbi:prepilin-type N-terminal cleavage/methylation domain-containing protein [Azotobacter chroococcum subsp. isscasi]|uniref:PilW family protein n=1 Tax=Azotobacter chroococcum TaxID=353 RepID=UPI00103E9BF5|nr:PilW family protein [Azotobacter chroococcum]TBW06582.1 prepilin-type N-terminal cleavage/methylation domain-containing protein [Azotobacter chroococcum subsp. isscasi]